MPMTTFGKHTTAAQALRGQSLRGTTAVVTGASSGIGIETVRALAQAGATVVLAVRNVRAGEDVVAQLRTTLPAGAQLIIEQLDLSDLVSVRAFVERYKASGRPLSLLINNAGVMATPLGTTAQGFETQVGTNHLGHFALTRGLLPVLAASRPARIVNVSSDLHTRGRGARLFETLENDPKHEHHTYVPFDAYGDSKLANVLFTKALVHRLPEGVEAFSIHPGVIATSLTRSMGIQGALFRFFGRPFFKSVPEGAATTVYAATAPELRGKSGAYLADCAVKTPSAEALNPAFAERLWAVSEAAVGR